MRKIKSNSPSQGIAVKVLVQKSDVKKRPEKELAKQESVTNDTKPPVDVSISSPSKSSLLRKRWLWWMIGAGVVIFLAAISAGGYVAYNRYFKVKEKEEKPTAAVDFKSNIGTLPQVQGVTTQNFANFQAEKADITPKIAPYKIEKNLANIENKDQFNDYELTTGAKSLLEKNAFVVTEGASKEFFQLYENNRYNSVPNFITVDSVLHNFHLLFDYSLKKLEEEKLIQTLRELNAGMLASSESQYNVLKGTA